MEATEEEKPLVLFFHRDGSEPSQRMTLKYLASYEVRGFLVGIPKAEINPDRGAGEKGLCTKYHVKRFPSFVVLIPGFGERDKRTHPFSKRGDMTPHEFLLAVKKTIARQYNRIGYVCFRDRQ